MASVEVFLDGSVIHAVYHGEMTMALIREGEQKIEALLRTVDRPSILYDTVDMDPPTIALAQEMKAFDTRIRDRVTRSATVVRDAKTAFMAKVAFVFARNHRVFYHDVDGALVWVQGKAAAAVPGDRPDPKSSS